MNEASLEINAPDGSCRRVRMTETPYMLGRGEQGNHLPIADDRVSRKCAAITLEGNRYYLEDRGNFRGVFLNGGRISREVLDDGDLITFGAEIPYSLVFRASDNETSIDNFVSSISDVRKSESSGGLEKLNLLLEATRLLHSDLPLDTVLDAMLDRAITVTDADRALLLEMDESSYLRPRLARRSGGQKLPPETLAPSRTAVNAALEQQSAVITEDLDYADGALQSAMSIVNQRLRAVVAIPLYAKARSDSDSSGDGVHERRFLGVMYLDSTRRAAFSKLDRQILDAIAIESASIIENARLVRLEQERRRVEQELNIARDIQQALLPRGFREFPHVSITGINMPCHAVGGDYFDILPVSADRISFLIADVSGKGLGAALLTTMLQGAFSGISTGSDPERIFQRINSFLCERSDVGRHATMFLGTLDSDGSLEYLNAGHPSPMLVRRGEVHDLYTRGSLPLGLMSECQYPVSRVKLEPDDRLILFSDGITEAENSGGEFFGESRLRSLLAGRHEAPLDVLQQDIEKAIERFSNGASQADDITLLIVRYKSRK